MPTIEEQINTLKDMGFSEVSNIPVQEKKKDFSSTNEEQNSVSFL